MTTHITKTWFDGEKVVTQEIHESEVYKQEPVAQIIALGQYEFPGLEWLSADHSFRAPIGTLLYTTPPAAQRQPLTEGRIWELAANCLDSVAGRLQFARAIEAAHGIKGEKK